RFLRRYIPRGGEDDIRLATLVVTRPVPNADALGAVLNRGIHIEVLKMQLLVGDDYIYIVFTPEAVIGYRQEAVHIGRKVNPSDGRALVENNVQEAGILVRETVVVLAPNRGCDQEVQRGYFSTPRHVVTDREPLRVLVEHGVNDVNKGFIGGEEAISPGKQIAFEHSLHGVLAEHLDHTSVGRKLAAILIFGEVLGDPEFLGDFVDCL